MTEMLELNSEVVWFQSGLMHDESARALVTAGINVAHECIGCRRAAISPGALPLEGQRSRPLE